MIIDIPDTDLELEMEPDGHTTLKEKGEDGDGYCDFGLAELLPLANALLRAYIAHIPTTKVDAQ